MKYILIPQFISIIIIILPIHCLSQVSIEIGTDMVLSCDNLTLLISGNWTNHGIFESGNSTITFNGSGTQFITNVDGEAFSTLTIDKPGDVVELNNNVTVNEALILTNGNLSTGLSTLTLASTASLSEEGAGRYVIGNLTTTRTVGTGASDFGNIGVELTAGTDDIGNVAITRISGEEGLVAVGSDTSIYRKWSISSKNPPSNGRDLTLSWVSDNDFGDLTTAQVWESTDGGTSWFTVGNQQDVTDSDPRSITISVTSFSEWTVSGGDNPLPVEDLFLPRANRLLQNYPNPFNPSTVIKFELQNTADVTINVYNVLGQQIKTLLNRHLPAGCHEIEFNSHNVSSGIYIYTIEANGFKDVKKMILLK